MDSCNDTPKGWVAPFGHPRIKACSRLPVAFRSVPRPSSPPGAKASTECPSLAQDLSPGTCPGDPPCTETILSDRRSAISRQQPLAGTTETKHQAPSPRTIPYRIISLSTQQTPLNTLPRPREDPAPTRNPRAGQTTSGQTCDRSAPRDAPEPDLHS
jgi:hypothetical protein